MQAPMGLAEVLELWQISKAKKQVCRGGSRCQARQENMAWAVPFWQSKAGSAALRILPPSLRCQGKI